MKKTIPVLVFLSTLTLGAPFAQADGLEGHHMQPQDIKEAAAKEAKARMKIKVEEHFQAMDTNNDGAVSKEEFDTAQAKRFKETDLNGDGKITPEEVKEAREKMREQRKSKKAPE